MRINGSVSHGAAWTVGLLACLYYLPRTPAELEPERLQVAAAISLREVLECIASDFEKETGTKVALTFGSSGQLLTQIRNGAPVDVFISAAHDQVDALEQGSYLLPGSTRIVAGNRLVLIVPKSADATPKSFQGLADSTVARVAIGDPSTVPAGVYAGQTLEHLDLLEPLKDRLLYGANVRQVLEYVARGEVSAGLVYATDVGLDDNRVKVVASADARWHQPIEYPGAILKTTAHAQVARQFLAYFASEVAVERLRALGFDVPDSHAKSHISHGSEYSKQTPAESPPGSGS